MEPLNVRDRIQDFASFRRAARRQQLWLTRQNADAALTPQVADDEDGGGANGGGDSAQQQRLPPWARAIESFTVLEATLEQRVEQLRRDQQALLTPRFAFGGGGDEDDERMRHDVDKLAATVQQLLKELERMVLHSTQPLDPNNADEVIAASNVRKHLTGRLTDLINKVRTWQERFASGLRKREQVKKKARQVGTDEEHARLEREEKIAGYMELGLSQADISELLVEEQRQSEMSREVEIIVSQIAELQEMFKDLGAMIVDQGTALDRVDYNIQRARDNVLQGRKELEKAREHQRKCTFM